MRDKIWIGKDETELFKLALFESKKKSVQEKLNLICLFLLEKSEIRLFGKSWKKAMKKARPHQITWSFATNVDKFSVSY